MKLPAAIALAIALAACGGGATDERSGGGATDERSGGGAPDEASLRESFAQQVASNEFVTGFIANGG
jgi:hypothetical protein